ncbi:hypothetical protein GCM10010417_53130 [Streptomyces carpaticus]
MDGISEGPPPETTGRTAGGTSRPGLHCPARAPDRARTPPRHPRPTRPRRNRNPVLRGPVA